MKFAFLLGALTLLLLVACVDEQWATPIGNETITNASAPAAQPAAAQPAAQPSTTAPAAQQQTAPAAAPEATTNTSAPQGSQTTTVSTNTTLLVNTTPMVNTNLTCTETDYLDDMKIKGTTTYVIPDKIYVKTDECIGNTLREWWCNKGELDVKLLECRYGCVDGACAQS